MSDASGRCGDDVEGTQHAGRKLAENSATSTVQIADILKRMKESRTNLSAASGQIEGVIDDQAVVIESISNQSRELMELSRDLKTLADTLYALQK